MSIKDFLKQLIEGYLFYDLDSMSKIALTPGQYIGAANYPIVLSTISGMEILGFILQPDNNLFSNRKGDEYFGYYWDEYFAEHEPKYKHLKKLFRKLIRHGLAHTFLTKNQIYITKGSNKQILINSKQNKVCFDAIVFYKDFFDSYNNLVKPIINNVTLNPKTSLQNMQLKLDSLEDQYKKDTIMVFEELANNFIEFTDIIPHMNDKITISGLDL